MYPDPEPNESDVEMVVRRAGEGDQELTKCRTKTFIYTFPHDENEFFFKGQLQQFELRLRRPLAPPLLRGGVQKGENLPFERRQLRTDRRQGKGIGGSDEGGRR